MTLPASRSASPSMLPQLGVHTSTLTLVRREALTYLEWYRSPCLVSSGDQRAGPALDVSCAISTCGVGGAAGSVAGAGAGCVPEGVSAAHVGTWETLSSYTHLKRTPNE